MNLIQRVQDILLKPKDTWPVIAQESGDVASIYKNYLVYLAAIPAIAKFIGLYILGFGIFGHRFGGAIVSGLVFTIVGYIVSLALVYGFAFIANELAPSFGGTKDLLAAFKLMAYSCTSMFVGGIFYLILALSPLALLAGLYGIYLLFLGAPTLMKVPADKAAGYTAVVFVASLVAMVILGAIMAAVMPMRAMMGGMY